MVQQNNPHLNFLARVNPIWESDPYCDVSDDDEVPDEDDPTCPTIVLTAEEKRQLRHPWRNALIIKMFDKGIGFMQLRRGLRKKWALKGDFSLIDIGFDYYVTRFSEREDYEYVLTQGPWMLGDNYVVIREWVPNFVPEETPITCLTAWVRIPQLSVEYFNKQFLLEKIGCKIGKVLRVDDTTANVERGQYTRLSVEVDLTKPLLSKFRLNGRIWRIQYEGLRMICFKCGKQGHKEESCPLTHQENLQGSPAKSKDHNADAQDTMHMVSCENNQLYGSWMLVKKPVRRKTSKQEPQASSKSGSADGQYRIHGSTMNPTQLGGRPPGRIWKDSPGKAFHRGK